MTESDAWQAGPKLDPETLALRARPERPIRFRRGAVIAIAGTVCASLAAVTWVALKPTFFQPGRGDSEMSQPLGKAPSDTLAALPTSYQGVPRLGPPLPGDLGRPILERQRQLEGAPPGGSITPPTPQSSARARATSDRQSARASALMVARSVVQPAASGPAASSLARSAAADAPAKPAPDPADDPNGQRHKIDFVSAAGDRDTVNRHALTKPISPYMLLAGSVIPASLLTGLRSDLPGMVVAQVTERVFDSATGRIELIPQGARLIGKYDSVVAFGQKRALIAWQRLVMPDGSSLDLENAPATDPQGYAGLEDKVDFHSWQLLKGIAMSSLLGVSGQLALGGDGDLVAALRRSTQDNVARAGDQLTSRNLSVQPTLTVRPGAPVRLLVHKDLILAPWMEGQ
ncbi:TrbI/VirB10 family protein [Sphingomonas sp.]|uniref:TrbI/VirB10 family protein n=1 Tax=Sphingomonas sp. TaxID=28214 RepID=UPI0025FD54E0|nr:TrbI/VirB10 family protein [Sphingomonas sp.]